MVSQLASRTVFILLSVGLALGPACSREGDCESTKTCASSGGAAGGAATGGQPSGGTGAVGGAQGGSGTGGAPTTGGGGLPAGGGAPAGGGTSSGGAGGGFSCTAGLKGTGDPCSKASDCGSGVFATYGATGWCVPVGKFCQGDADCAGRCTGGMNELGRKNVCKADSADAGAMSRCYPSCQSTPDCAPYSLTTCDQGYCADWQ